ncbi:hypothetical protein ACX0G9_15405 [Flavitalea flava]
MTNPAFALHLGNGVYLDSDGNITHGPAPVSIIYEAPFKLPIDPKKAADSLKAVADTLKGVNKSEKVIKDINEIYGLLIQAGATIDLDALLGLLSTIGKIAGTIAPILFVASFAIDLARVFKLFGGDEPTKFERLVEKRFNDVDAEFQAIALTLQGQTMIQGRVAIAEMVGDAHDYVNRLNNTNPSPSDLNFLSLQLNASVIENRTKLATLLDVQSWMTLFDPSRHSQIWALMQHQLFLLPGGPSTPPVQARLPQTGTLEFDHRLMVPLASYAAEAFLAGIQALAPEYRSTGIYRDSLHDFANAIGNLAENMRSEVLARTIYTAADFNVLLYPAEVITTDDFFNPQPIVLSPTCSRFPVGALDLRYHDNLFFASFLTDLFKAEFYGWQRTTRKATMDFRWIPPAKLTISHGPDSKFDGYRITNPDECAAAANAQSESDYADLLAVSGYPQLLQLMTLLRHETTDPDISQTVQIFTPVLNRHPLEKQSVTIESEPVPLTGKITSPAIREPQKCLASVEIWTQPLNRVLPIEYKIRLRTLKSFWGTPSRWREPLYSSVQFLHYEPVLNDRDFMELHFDERDGALDFTVDPLLEGHSKPEGYPHQEFTIQLKAHTFDWYIPIKPPFSLTVPVEKTEATLRGLGHTTTTADNNEPKLAFDKQVVPGAHFGNVSDVLFENSFPRLSFLDGSQDWEGEHRELKEEDVTITYKLDWKADRMLLQIEADPKDRNFIVYVVIEEQLQGGEGHILHTAMPIPINGQLTYVPQSFFDEERAAIEKAAKAAAEFNRKYSHSTVVGPSDPIVGWLRPGDLGTLSGLNRVLTLAAENQPEILQEVLTESQNRSGFELNYNQEPQ